MDCESIYLEVKPFSGSIRSVFPTPDLEISEKLKDATNENYRAINMMDLIYSRASEVLVLDHELQRIKGGTQLTPVIGEGILHPRLRPFLGPSDDRLTQTLAFVFGSTWRASYSV